MNKAEKIIKILKKSQEGVRRTNLNREAKDNKNYTPFQTLISCIISLRVKDEISEVISRELFKVASTPKQILELPVKKLEKIIFSSGYYKNKAKAIKKISKRVVEFGHVPNTEEGLLELYGVGRKTANIVLCFSFGRDVIPVDVNVHRVSNRLGLVRTKDWHKTEYGLMKIFPRKYWRDINGIFILHGKRICVPISPWCSKCPVGKYCQKVGVKKRR